MKLKQKYRNVFGAVGRRPDGGFHWGNDGFVIKVGTPTPV
jgi:hypothetical protein